MVTPPNVGQTPSSILGQVPRQHGAYAGPPPSTVYWKSLSDRFHSDDLSVSVKLNSTTGIINFKDGKFVATE
jgi:hypothetical protein